MIKKGTYVRLQTTNGGDITAVVQEDHHPSFDLVATTDRGGRVFVVEGWRIKSIEVIDQ